MVAIVKFTAVDSAKYIRVTDKLGIKPEPKKQFQELSGDEFAVEVSTFEGTNKGEVSVEVSRDDKTYADHDPAMRVVDNTTYSINDSKLPKQEKLRAEQHRTQQEAH